MPKLSRSSAYTIIDELCLGTMLRGYYIVPPKFLELETVIVLSGLFVAEFSRIFIVSIYVEAIRSWRINLVP